MRRRGEPMTGSPEGKRGAAGPGPQNWSIAVRLFLVNLLLSAIVFGIFGWWFFRGMRDLGIRNAYDEAASLVSQTNHIIDGVADTIRNTLFLITADDRLAGSEGPVRAREPLANYGEVAASLFRGIYLVRDDGTLSASRQVLAEVLGTAEIRALAARARSAPGRIIAGAPYTSFLSGFTLAFAYRPPRMRLVTFPAAAVAEIDPDYLSSRLGRPLAGNGRAVLICTEDNQPLAYDKNGTLLPAVPASFPRRLDTGAIDRWSAAPASEGFIDDGEFLVVRSDRNELGWKVYAVYLRSAVAQAADKVVQNLRAAYFALICFLILEALFVSFYFSRPLRHLVREMDRIGAIHDLRPITVDRDDEIGSLMRSYNALIERISAMTDEVRDAELKMLQSQIGPHFLYNTLACIGTLAAKNRSVEVRSTIRALVDLLSFTFDRGPELVSLEEELRSVEAYAAIQRVRYGDGFQVELNIADDTRSMGLPRLTLQPLVENALFHGIVPKRSRGKIRIVSRIREGCLFIWVGDGGVGMDAAQVRNALNHAALNHAAPDRAALKAAAQPMDGSALRPTGGSALRSADGPASRSGEHHDRLNRIGLPNVDRRIKARYGDAYGLALYSRAGKGTVVALRLPATATGAASAEPAAAAAEAASTV